MKKLIESIKYWGQVFLLPIYWFSFLIPRDKHIWLFGSTFGKRFADNPRYFYLYLNQFKKNKIRAIWISHEEKIVKFLNKNGYEAYYYLSLKGIWYCLRGKVYLFDNYSKDINFWTSGGAIKINLWHGVPLKKIQANNKFDRFRNPRNIWDKFSRIPRTISDEKPSHYITTTSKHLVNIFSSAFKTNNVIVSGYPRCDVLVSKKLKMIYTNSEREAVAFLKSKKERKIIVYYMPTFRKSESEFFDVINLEKFNQFLEKESLFFCVKLHSKSNLEDEFRMCQNKNLILFDANLDSYALLKYADILITDYSSIYFDFLLLNKPIIFFPYDLEKYITNSREFYFSYESFTPGKKVYTMQQLLVSLKEIISNREHEKWKKKRNLIKEIVFDPKTELSSEYLYNSIRKILY